MNKINLLLSFLCLPLLVVAQGVFPLVSPSGKMNADIRAGEKNVEIDLFANGEKVVTAKTLQFSLDENILKGNWKVVDQKRKSVDQTWQPVYGERSVVTDRYNEVELTLQSDENWKEMVLSVRLYDERHRKAKGVFKRNSKS